MTYPVDNLDLSALPSVALADRALLPNVKAIYIVHANGEVLYIGRTSELFRRWKNHNRFFQFAAIGASRISWFDMTGETTSIDALEAELIKRHRPTFNVSNKPYVGKRRDGDREVKVQLPADLRRKITDAADAMGITQAEIIFAAIRQFDTERYAAERTALSAGTAITPTRP